jgi:hypothetical protein
MLQAGRSWFEKRSSEYIFSQFTKSFSQQYALEFTQPLTEMDTRSRKIMFWGSRVLPVRMADIFTASCEPIVLTMWEPQYVKPLYASTACYADSFLFFFTIPFFTPSSPT